MHKLVFGFIIIVVAISGNADAQLPAFRNYGIREGLPSTETYCVFQDSRGYIYIGTDKGLVRFDGTTFETFTTADGLVDNTVFLVFEDREKIWYYTLSGPAGHIMSDSFYAYPHNEALRKMVIAAPWATAFWNREGMILLNKLQGQGYVTIGVNEQGKPHIPFPAPTDPNERNIYLTSYGRSFTTGNEAANNINVLSEQIQFVCRMRTGGKGARNAFGYIRGDKTWVCVNNTLFEIYNRSCKKIIDLEQDILYVCVDNSLNIWVGYRDRGLALYRPADGYRQPLRMLSSYSISCIIQDREGGMWFTTLENGVYYLPPDFLFSYGDGSNLTNVKSVKILTQNNQPVLLTDRSLMKLDKRGSWKAVFPGERIYSAASAEDGNIYITSGEIRPGPTAVDSFIRVYGTRIMHIGATVLAAADHRVIFSNKPGRIVKEVAFPQIPRITCIEEIKDSVYLIGTLMGLFIYQNRNLIQLSTDSTVVHSRISDIAKSDDRHVALALHGNGVVIMNRNSYRVVARISAVDGLRGIAVNVIYRQNDTTLWVGTNDGLGRISHPADSKKRIIHWTDINDGLISNEVNDIRHIDSQLWVATSKGVTLYPLSKNLAHIDSIPLVVKSVTVNGYPKRKLHSPLRYSENNISVSFAGLSYHYQRTLRYCYRLRGKKTPAWEFTVKPTVNYSSLPPGVYSFDFGVLTPNQKTPRYYSTLQFTILPPFWLRWWFIALATAAVITLAYRFVHGRFRSVRKQMQLVTDLNMYRDKALRNQMSPHFIYNSLNLVESFIIQENTDASISVISKFSRLMRLIFKNTGEELVTIDKDLEALKLYIDMECMRFPGRFIVNISQHIRQEYKYALIPPLLLQPFVENAILHGLLPKKEGGSLGISISEENGSIRVTIEDDGIGRKKAEEIKRRRDAYRSMNPGEHRKDSGTTITIARIKQRWGKRPEYSRFKIVDLYNADGTPAGTLVEYYLPLVL